ncbi:MAG: multidrug resistance transporter, superfamily protein [Naasia sp.]|jgi:DHA2 family lincomycin resistance protein-like MFS transporter|uniref:DHA2 family efflux MFS transporter permease subunit n=1 Tax=Naasia sp. TaxID=2546198 RepID=UPI002610F014|nr:DHA2 family efflux MFS transporter permease subunit [Naasia sp.]MCU1569480.1 multidrug resistance transporter, superfamily protein [Naasia sp.]
MTNSTDISEKGATGPSPAQLGESPAVRSADVASSAEAGHHGGERLPRHHRNVIAVLMIAAFTVILNETVMSVALPVLQEDLGIGPSIGQWLTTAFMLTMAVVIPITGFLIQRIRTRTLFVLAMSLFSAGTLLAALSPGFGVLLLARVIQASGTAIMMPLLMTTVMTLVPVARRGQMMGNISIVISVAPALGPTVSGFIIDNFGWRWIFGFVLPIALLTLGLGAKWMVSVSETSRAKIDLISIPLAALGFGGLVYGLASIGQSAEGGGGVPIWVLFTLGGVSLLLFLVRQLLLQRSDRALLDLRVFSSPIFSIAMGAMVLATATMFGTFILIPFFAQRALGLNPLETGLLTLPGGLLMGIASPFIGRIYDARGPLLLLLPGALLISGSMWVLTTVSAETPMWLLIVTNITLSLGLAATFTPLMTSGLGSVKPHLYSHGSAVVGTFQQVAAAAGTALFVTVLAVGAAGAGADVSGVAGTVAGTRLAFLVGAFLSLALVASVFFVRKPANAPGGFSGH